ncbi:MAG TPA: hypothetical protein VL588_09365, partial [Bdellovibrionota bacterium]|nr:hypothetical protein [Bdellovibrionota bacterium]
MKAAAALAIALALAAPAAQAATANVSSPDEALVSARRLYNEGRYFQASRYAFLAGASDRLRGEAYSLITVSLVHAGLYQSAAYFFIRTLQEGDQIAVRRALTVTEALFRHVDGDLFRRYLIRRTQPGDYDASNRSAFAYAVGKEALLRGDEAAAVRQLDSVSHSSPLWPFSLQIRATAKAILGDSNGALHDFEECASRADSTANRDGGDDQWLARAKAEASDLKARCQAGVARSLYEQGRFRDADKAYDEIPKASFVWTDILFEQAWNAYAEREYNRTLGKLVTYKSPGLSFVFNPEVDVLTAQAYLALCLYGDANQVINAFNGKYEKVGKDVKRFVDTTGLNLLPYYEAGKKAMKGRLHQAGDFDRLMNRFVRAPYFRRLVDAEESLPTEQAAIR